MAAESERITISFFISGNRASGEIRAQVLLSVFDTKETVMPGKRTIEAARRDKRQGKAPSTQAGEFVREEMDHIRHGKHGARSTKQAIAIGLSKARRAGVALPPPKKGKTSSATRRGAQLAIKKSRSGAKPSPTRSRATENAL